MLAAHTQVPAPSIVCGIHLMPVVGAVATARPSCVVVLDAAGTVLRITTAADDEAIARAVPQSAAVVAVDAPLAVPNRTGTRPVDQLLGWLDITVFPVSGERLEKVYGGARGPCLLERLRAPGRLVVETAPDAVLRELAWEAEHPPVDDALDLAVYRERWRDLRTARYRPKGTGRAVPSGRASAWTLLASGLDLGGWAPDPSPDDWAAIADAAVLDAMAAAYAALRLSSAPAHVLAIDAGGIPFAVPADANLLNRGRLHGERLGVPVSDGAGSVVGAHSHGNGN